MVWNGNSRARYTIGRYASSTAARPRQQRPRARQARSRQRHRTHDREQRGERDPHVRHRVDDARPERRRVVAVGEEGQPVRRSAVLPADLDGSPTHRGRPVDADELEDGRPDVHELHVARALRRARAQQPGLDAGRPHRRDGEHPADRRRGRSHHHDRVARRIDPFQQRAHQCVGRPQRVLEDLFALAGRHQVEVRVGAHEIGRFDEHDRARIPHRVERVDHSIDIESTTERGTCVVLEQPAVDAAVPARFPARPSTR